MLVRLVLVLSRASIRGIATNVALRVIDGWSSSEFGAQRGPNDGNSGSRLPAETRAPIHARVRCDQSALQKVDLMLNAWNAWNVSLR